MPPTGDVRDVKSIIKEFIDLNKVMLFSKSWCPFCKKVKDLLNSLGVQYKVLEIDLLNNGADMQTTLTEMFNQKTVPLVIIEGQNIGGYDNTVKLHNEGKLLPMIYGELSMGMPEGEDIYQYDLIVIGGGSGGLAAAKEASEFGKKVMCLDYVTPTPIGTKWGLGGTCVNVGCIPKKLMHQASILGENIKDSNNFGWEINGEVNHNWSTMKDNIQDHIKSLNWGYRSQLKSKNVVYENANGSFVGPNTIKVLNSKGVEKEVTAKYIIIATGGRPKYPDIPGAKEYCITSDDIFSLSHCPGKTLTVGASYVSLECAGFLKGLGLDVSVMVRSILLRGFDQQIAKMIGEDMESQGIKFYRPYVPTKIEKIEDGVDGYPGKYRVTACNQDDLTEIVEEYNTILIATGRDPCTSELNLGAAGIKIHPRTGFIICDNEERTSCPNIFAIGDIVQGRPELTPVAIQAGRLLAKRLFNGSKILCDYTNVPTTVFTPMEYGSIGLTEEDAILRYGDDLEIYHQIFTPLEWKLNISHSRQCYAKLLCVKSLNNKVVGFHILSPNAGEITQGWTVGIKLGATKEDFDNSIGIHPTVAEVFTTLNFTKQSNENPDDGGC